ncbi:MAG: hypothetical protein K6F93_05300, partial [Lachnospiraceae bacterium]|nr:hypothetical protein [Lachnospiraceae bacterium]
MQINTKTVKELIAKGVIVTALSMPVSTIAGGSLPSAITGIERVEAKTGFEAAKDNAIKNIGKIYTKYKEKYYKEKDYTKLTKYYN